MRGTDPKGGAAPGGKGTRARQDVMNDTLEQAIDRRAHGDWISWLVSRQTNDQIDLAHQQMADVFTAHSDLGAFTLAGGWAQFGPQAYAQVTDQVMDKLQSKDLVIVAGDTLPPQMQALKDGRSHAQIGQRPFEMGYRAPSVMIDLIEGKKTVGDPLYTGLDECTTDNVDSCIAK